MYIYKHWLSSPQRPSECRGPILLEQSMHCYFWGEQETDKKFLNHSCKNKHCPKHSTLNREQKTKSLLLRGSCSSSSLCLWSNNLFSFPKSKRKIRSRIQLYKCCYFWHSNDFLWKGKGKSWKYLLKFAFSLSVYLISFYNGMLRTYWMLQT